MTIPILRMLCQRLYLQVKLSKLFQLKRLRLWESILIILTQWSAFPIRELSLETAGELLRRDQSWASDLKAILNLVLVSWEKISAILSSLASTLNILRPLFRLSTDLGSTQLTLLSWEIRLMDTWLLVNGTNVFSLQLVVINILLLLWSFKKKMTMEVLNLSMQVLCCWFRSYHQW